VREKYGEPDVIEVRQTFNDSLQAREWEYKVLRKLRVDKSNRWLNKGLGKSIPPQFGRIHSEETRKKMRESRYKVYEKDPTIVERAKEKYKKTTSTKEWKFKKIQSVKQSCTENRNQKISQRVKESWKDQNHKNKRIINIKKTLNSEEYKMSKRCSCIVCHKETNIVGLIRFHKHLED
jgi:hypothetical protein